MSNSERVGQVLSELVPAVELELGGAFTIETETRRLVDADGIEVITMATLHLPAAVRRLTLSPGALVKQAPQELLREIIDTHLKPFVADMKLAGNDTAATWVMATQAGRRPYT